MGTTTKSALLRARGQADLPAGPAGRAGAAGLAGRRTEARRILDDQRGIGLPVALLALIVVGILSAGMWMVVDASAKATQSREGTLEAQLLAQAGLEHALSLLQGPLADVSYTRLLRGFDNVPNTDDDGYLIDYPLLLLGNEIPPEGRDFGPGRYHVRIMNDPGDLAGPWNDTNDRVLIRSTGTMPNGASATVETVLGDVEYGAVGFLADGDVKINGNVDLIGECAGVHANANLDLEGNLRIDGPVTSTGPATLDGTIRTPDGQPVVPKDGLPPRPVPEMDPTEYCVGADYTLLAGSGALSGATPVNPATLGWSWSNAHGGTWNATNDDVAEGTYCIMGNARISGNLGKNGGPAEVTLIATGSVQFTGTPYIAPAHDDDILILAGGDVSIGGNTNLNPGALFNYSGTIYAGSQCEASGNVTIHSSLLCKNNPNPPGARNLADDNRISGNPTLVNDSCGDEVYVVRQMVSWQQRFAFDP